LGKSEVRMFAVAFSRRRRSARRPPRCRAQRRLVLVSVAGQSFFVLRRPFPPRLDVDDVTLDLRNFTQLQLLTPASSSTHTQTAYRRRTFSLLLFRLSALTLPRLADALPQPRRTRPNPALLRLLLDWTAYRSAKTEVNGGKEVGEKEWDTLVKAGEKVKELCREKGLKIFILQPFGASFSSFPTLSFPSLPPSSSH
jgi:hypothetical protein